MKKIYLLVVAVFFVFSCEKEELVEPQDKNSKNHFTTVSKKEAVDLLQNLTAGKSGKSSDLSIFYDQMQFENIKNSDQHLTVIPAQTKYAHVDSRILLLKIEGELKHVLFNMIANEEGENKNLFSGRIIISDLNLKFITGYRVKNGILVSKFVQSEPGTNKYNECEDNYWRSEDLTCNQGLEEVYLTYTKPQQYHYISVQDTQLDEPTGSEGYGEEWEYSGGGGSSSTGSYEDFEETLNKKEVLEEDTENPLFKVNCATFEYYKPPGSLVTAAAVDNMHEYFYSAEIMRDGRTRFNQISVKYNRIYFTMPSWRRNGEAANMTAEAVTNAVNATHAWYLLNPSASTISVSDRLIQFMQAAMISIGGQFSKVAPFPIRNGGEYQTSLLSSGNCD